MIARDWVRVPEDDDQMFGIRCYWPADKLTVKEIHGQNFLHLKEDGSFVRREHTNLTTGSWVADRDLLTLFNDDVIFDEYKYVIKDDRLLIGG